MPDTAEPITATQAQALAQQFHDLGAAIGAYRLQKVGTLTDAEQARLQNQQMRCIAYSTSFITLGLSLEQSSIAPTLQSIKQATAQAQAVIAAVGTVDEVLQVIAAVAVLGASIASLNPSAISSGVQGVLSAITGAGSSTAAASSSGNGSSTSPSGGGSSATGSTTSGSG